MRTTQAAQTKKRRHTMNTSLQQYQAAQTAADRILASIKDGVANTPDATEKLQAELEELTHEELVAKVIELTKVGTNKAIKVEDVAKALLCDKDCAILPYDSIASLVKQAIPGAETSSKSIASYFSKKGEEWGAVKRVRMNINPIEFMNAAKVQLGEELVLEQEHEKIAAEG
jgi:hypothetical protein